MVLALRFCQGACELKRILRFFRMVTASVHAFESDESVCRARREARMQVDPQFYAFRWVTLLLTQEFEFPELLRLWDALLADPAGQLRICACLHVPIGISLSLCCHLGLTCASR